MARRIEGGPAFGFEGGGELDMAYEFLAETIWGASSIHYKMLLGHVTMAVVLARLGRCKCGRTITLYTWSSRYVCR